MQTFLIANPKGGVGKSTLATNLVGYLARAGNRVMLGDIDRQQSSREWLKLRSAALPPIASWDMADDRPAKPPKDTTHVVLDSPAGLHGKKLAQVLKQANRVIVPLQASIFDILATRDFLQQLTEEKSLRQHETFVAIVAMRVDPRTRAAGELERFLVDTGLPVIAHLRDTQNYVQTAAHGMSIFDLSSARSEKDREQWQPLLAWVNQT
ncbi:cobyrinic acid a,c-diamide synthase [Rugosibacter aromaticivorans]|uniref:Cobyrinic acid a,c-diamide synthase n=1 Tax=Rugosibacter aromaticivorans TaxID=1565605 RepID=A0A0C5JJX9_9PROT|nr:ParA family protein [Rugosibacter aromaticivorans]AJP47631.1 cobyrinic acid a,c-diamide synthase [Rugosibacter aromaticivorans]